MRQDPFTTSKRASIQGLKIGLIVIVLTFGLVGILFFAANRASSISNFIKERFKKKTSLGSIAAQIQPSQEISLPEPEKPLSTFPAEPSSPEATPAEASPQQTLVLEGKLLSETKEDKKIFSLELSETSLNGLLERELLKESVSTIQLQDKGLLPEEWLNQSVQLMGVLTVPEPPNPPSFEVQQATLLPS